MGDENQNQFANVVAIWGIQEALLQQYRTIFITLQAIFIAVASSVFQRPDPWLPMIVLFVLAMFTLWLWLTICARRARTVLVCQFLALKAEAGEALAKPLSVMKDFEVSDRPDSTIAKDPLFVSLSVNNTRRRMQVYLPAVFGAAWVLLWLDILLHHWALIFVRR